MIQKQLKHHSRNMSKSIVKDSKKLREALKARFKELKMTQAKVAEDATKRGQKGITRMSINKYFNQPYVAGALNEYQILWLSWRWLVPVMLSVGIPDAKVNYEVPKKYDKDMAMKYLKKMFPK